MDLQVQIVRFVLWHQPPIVEAHLVDADGRLHAFVEKEAMFTAEWLDANSTYPQPSGIRCEILDQWRDTQNPELIRVTTRTADGVESTEGLTEFVVRKGQLS